MSILGIRATAKEFRYAIIEQKDDCILMINKSEENRLIFPSAYTKESDKLAWLYFELKRILLHYGGITKICLKKHEFGSDSNNSRFSCYCEAVVLLVAAEKHIDIDCFLYSQLKIKSNVVLEIAENKVGRTHKYWNKSIAEAILVACKGIV